VAAGLLLLLAFGIYRPENWTVWPSLDEVRCISATGAEVYVATPPGVCVFDRTRYRLVRTLTRADGIAGEIRLCVHNPARGDVFIATDDRVYRYVPATDRVEELTAPFKYVSSIGVNALGAYFETDAGAFFRARNAAGFEKMNEFPPGLNWYGERDTIERRDFPFLTPYTVMDEQLLTHPITRVRPDRNGRKLFAVAAGYGIIVYNVSTGFSEAHIRFGPSGSTVSRIARLDNRLWLVGGETAVSLDSAGDWHYFLTRPGDLSAGGFRLLLGNVTGLKRSEGLRALAADSVGLLFGTDLGIYSLGADDKLAQLLSLPRPVNGLLRLGDSLIFGTELGLYLSVGESVVEYSDPSGATAFGVYDIITAGNGTAYFGTVGGVVARTRAGEWKRYVPPGMDLRTPVKTIAASGARVFMAAGSGVTVLDTRDGSYTAIDSSRGLPNSDISALYADGRYLWVASPGLLTRLDYTAELK